MEQRTEGWRDIRLGMLTSSQFDKLMGIKGLNQTGLNYIKKQVNEAITQVSTDIYSYHLQWGIDHEEEAFQYAKKVLKIPFNDAIFTPYNGAIKELIGYVGGTPDGIYEDIILELKCPSVSDNHFNYFLNPKSLFEEYKWQVIGEMFVTNSSQAIICSYDPRHPDESKFVFHHVKRIELMAEFALLQERLLLAVEEYKKIVELYKSRKNEQLKFTLH